MGDSLGGTDLVSGQMLLLPDYERIMSARLWCIMQASESRTFQLETPF